VSTPEGISVKLDGTPDEIAAVVRKLKAKASSGRTPRPSRKLGTRPGLVDLIDSLVDGGFFRKPRDLAAVKSALAEMGHRYPMTTLSGAMLRQVRRKNLRRAKREKRWFYTRGST